MRFLFVLTMLALLLSCANYKTKYNRHSKSWESEFKSGYPASQPQYVLYGIGDAGYLPDGEISAALVQLKKMAADDTAPHGVVFLGDNIYPRGMPNKKDEVKRAEAEANIDAQIDVAKAFNKDIFFIPGNHDWMQPQPQKGVKRQEKYIEDQLDKDVFFPDDGCSDPEDLRLSKDVVLILIDSEWYIKDWDGIIDFNEKCDYKTRFDFLYKLKDELKKACKDKRVIVAMHHPIFTYGPHGGKFGWKDHVFPLRNMKNPVNIPLPVIGSIYPILRPYASSEQDINGDNYKELRSEILSGTDVFDDVIFLSGHEHAMQYIFREDHHHVIAGSGSKSMAVGMGEGSEFASSQLGFTRLSIFSRGETWIEYYSCNKEGAKLVFARKIAGQLPQIDEEEMEFIPPTRPYVEERIIEKDLTMSGFGKFMLGEQYSKLYNMPIRGRVTNLSIKDGGLYGVKRGGGFQTNSVRLENSQGREWVMRAIRKDPTRLLPDEFNNTVAEDAVEHFLTTAHPLAAYTLPPMAEAIDILHTKPELVYIPKQPALGEFNLDHGDKLYLYEDRPGGDRRDRDNFGNSEDIIGTDDLVEEMKENGRDRPDQHDVIRNRLFDMIIGDWDRHDDQWRWAKFEGPGKEVTYRPVPRDRDQAYSIFEGQVIALARIFSPAIAKFQTFDHKIKNVKFFNFNARYFDRSFLNELNWADWQKEIEHIQKNLTDEVIHEGVSLMQKDVYEMHGEAIEAKLRSRRDGLMKYARKYYKELMKEVDIIASDDDDLIEVTRKGDDVHLRINEIDKDGDIKYTYVDHTYTSSETKDLRIYGLDGDDRFVVSGDKNKMKVRLIGGTDDDVFTGEGTSGKNLVYDYPGDTKIEDDRGLKLRLTDDYYDNTYDRKAYKYDYSFPFPLAGYNPDNGFLLGLTYTGTWHGFKKQPYSMYHRINGLYSFATNGFRFDYFGRFTDVFSDWNLRIEGLAQGEFFTDNYFGLGNETVNQEEDPFDEDRDYNRLRSSIIGARILMEQEIGSNGKFFLGPKLDIREVHYQSDRFIGSIYDEDNVVFQSITYLGGEVGFEFNNRTDIASPHRGMKFKITGDYLTDVEGLDLWKVGLNTSLSLYKAIDNGENLVWAQRFGAGFTFGDDALFYHQQQLGGSTGLRGYRNERFTGNSMFFYQTDLRWRLFSFNSYFAPSTVGIYGGFDVGRVWLKSEDSSKWHNDFGGGVWIDPFDMLVLSLGYFTSGKERGRVLFSMGFDF